MHFHYDVKKLAWLLNEVDSRNFVDLETSVGGFALDVIAAILYSSLELRDHSNFFSLSCFYDLIKWHFFFLLWIHLRLFIHTLEEAAGTPHKVDPGKVVDLKAPVRSGGGGGGAAMLNCILEWRRLFLSYCRAGEGQLDSQRESQEPPGQHCRMK